LDHVPEQVPDAETERINLPLPALAFRPQAADAPPAKAPPVPIPLAVPTSLSDAVRTAVDHPGDRSPEERAVELFDLGMALRARRRYQEALHAWQKALDLAPDNLVYQANFQRLRAQLQK
jgi:tetratricopeptide (TPR) repeat protein